MKIVPDVPKLILQPPAPTVPVPTAAAALSPAPATTLTVSGRPSVCAASFVSVPTTAKLSKSCGIWLSETPQMSSISFDQHLCCTSSSSMPEASE